MSPSHTYTVGAAAAAAAASLASLVSPDDEDDNDICPVCDGECTCNNRPRSSISPNKGRAQRASPHRASNIATPNPQPLQPTLKIRLTIPPSILGKRRTNQPDHKKSKSAGESTSTSASKDQEILAQSQPNQKTASISHSMQNVITTKRRGRPPKSSKLIMASRIKGDVAPTFSGSSKSFRQSPSKLKNTRQTYDKSHLKKSSATRPRPPPKAVSRKISRRSVIDDSGSDLTDISSADDRDGSKFPTFVSASESSSSDGSESDSSSSIGSELSIEEEEEDYIISEERRAHEKARVRRELLGDEGQSKWRDARDSWIIRPRKKSVGPSDVEMDGDSDSASEDDDDEEEDGEDEEDEAEPDGRDPDVHYVGVATGWSEDEESSFDADLFFANLSDSTADQDDSSQAGDPDDDAGDTSVAEATITALSPLDLTKQELDNLLFEVTEAWDGQVVFTNSLSQSQGILDIDFEVKPAQLIIETSPAPTPSTDLDVEMSDGEDKEYEDEDTEGCNLDHGEGDTTDEELVCENGLPTEHAMGSFRFPSGVSAIDPMLTLSPTSSPVIRSHRRVKSQVGSPKPADILAGKMFWEESDDRIEGTRKTRGSRSFSLRSHQPIMGQFDPIDPNPQKRAIIDHSGNKSIPSPFRRHRRGRGGSLTGSVSRRGTSRSSSFTSSNRSSLQVMSPVELFSPISPELPLAEPIDLNDVLDVSFLDSDPSDNQSPSNTSTELESRKHPKNLNRWDVIPVGAFRQTRETAGNSENPTARWSSEAGPSSNGFPYGHVMKKNSLGTMLFNNRPPNSSTQVTRSSGSDTNVLGSPVILPVRDGNRTPTNLSPTQIVQDVPNQQHTSQKKRKETRREKKKPFKSTVPVPNKHQHYQHHRHQHHPNLKTRSSSSMQRTNFFSSPASSVPSLNI